MDAVVFKLKSNLLKFNSLSKHAISESSHV